MLDHGVLFLRRLRCITAFPPILLILAMAGCRNPPLSSEVSSPEELAELGLSSSAYVQSVDAVCPVPHNWRAEPLKHSGNHTHQVWLSPSGDTAYGVIRFSLPLPLGHSFVLSQFLRQMRQSEGEAILLEEQWDPNLHGIRFVAEGGLYRIRTNLMVRGFRGWAVYAGTLRDKPVQPQELELAERARDHTAIGRPEVVK
jgi:hypothetical protein